MTWQEILRQNTFPVEHCAEGEEVVAARMAYIIIREARAEAVKEAVNYIEDNLEIETESIHDFATSNIEEVIRNFWDKWDKEGGK